MLNYRTVRFARENGIGIRLAGGNKVGIYICDVQYNSPAERAGLKLADKLIKVNGVDYSTLTREEAVHHILTIQNMIEMVVAHSPDDYEQYAFDPLGGDSFYVRAHFNYTSPHAIDLSFKINDILHVTDTLYNGVMGQWVATKLSDSSVNTLASGAPLSGVGDQFRGTIPNQTSAEQLVANAQTIDQLCAAGNLSNPINNLSSIGASARMSIRKKLGRATLTKRSKSASRSNANSDSESTAPAPVSAAKISKANTFCGSKYPAYERVVLKEVNFVRPVVIFGALADVAREKLKQEQPGKFELPDSYSTDADSQSAGVIKLASIKAIIDKNHHCLLDITPNAVEHLNYAQYFPICVYLKADSHGHVKELRHKYAKNLKLKSSKRLYENAMRLETYYSHLFTAAISLDSAQWTKKLKETIDLQQEQPLWISQDLDQLLATANTPSATKSPVNEPTPNYDLNLQQQKFIAKQNQLMKYQFQQQQHQQHEQSKINSSHVSNRYVLDDNFEFPIYTSTNAGGQFAGISGAASTYSLYEDQNYRSSYAASDSDVCISSSNPVDSSSMLKQQPQQPIYSTNFNATNRSTLNMNTIEQLNSTPNKFVEEQSLLTRFKSDSNLGKEQQAKPTYEQENEKENWKKFATYSNAGKDQMDNSKPAFIQKTNQIDNSNKRLSATSDYASLPQQSATAAPSAQMHRHSSGYKLIKSSQSSLMPSVQSALIDNSMHYTELNEQQLQQQTSSSSLLNRSLLQPINKSLDSKFNDIKIGDHFG